jgi:hypothetical protein
MAERSPNFPQLSLREALDNIRLIYQKEGRSRMPRLSAVKPLGYTSINGRSLGVLGALRAYDLIEGRGDDVRISDDAFTIINAPANSEEKRAALIRAFEAPSAFALLRAQGEASADTMKWHLQKANFRDDSADKLLRIFLDSKELVNAEVGGYDASSPVEKAFEAASPMNDVVASVMPFPAATNSKRDLPPYQAPDQQGLAMGIQERVLQSGMLSKHASFRVLVTGSVGVAEIEKLIAKIEMDKDILAEPDPMPAGDDRDYQADYESGKSID